MKSTPESIHLFKPLIDTGAALKEIEGVLNSGFINEGVQVTELTSKLRDLMGSQNLILLNSCTSALTIALELAGVKRGDDVVTTSMTCVATNMPIKNVGANIVWADVDPDTGMLSSSTIDSAITSNTKAVIVVLWAGNPPELDKIYTKCKKKGVKLIIDAAHGFLAEYSGKPVHKFADYTCYSFQAIKHFTTGDGGALVCNDKEDFDLSKKMKWFGLDRDKTKDEKGNWKGQQWDVDIDCVGHKFNMNNVSAAIGLSQIERSVWAVKAHRENAETLDKLFESCSFASPIKKADKANGSSWVYTVILDESVAKHRDKILEKLNEVGVKAGVVHIPNHYYTCFKDEMKRLPGVDSFFSRQLSLPCGWWLSEKDVKRVFEDFVFYSKYIIKTEG